jgi:hypothetical protein
VDGWDAVTGGSEEEGVVEDATGVPEFGEYPPSPPEATEAKPEESEPGAPELEGLPYEPEFEVLACCGEDDGAAGADEDDPVCWPQAPAAA